MRPWRTVLGRWCAVGLLAAMAAGCTPTPSDPLRSTAETPPAMPIRIDVSRELGPISPLIRGMSGADASYFSDAGITLNSWGGNPATRYNYRIGHAWNTGADWNYRNVNYRQAGDSARRFLLGGSEKGVATRLAVPTLGWVAKDSANTTCSFPTEDGSCTDGGGATCNDPGPVADPRAANVRNTSKMVQEWIADLVAAGIDIPFIAMDNEPELWGHTHYDVHPQCTTYEEILRIYLEYATAIDEVSPESQLLGPVTCCWYSFWRTAPGPTNGPYRDFLPWFLEQVRRHDEQHGARTLDVLDVHYYPQSQVYNDKADSETAARRLRSTRSLYDRQYVDESWIDERIFLIPRLLQTIEETYPGTALAISEWNFGADQSMNGALAIADVLGIYGREGVYLAAYWRRPEKGTPGYFAFKMHGNYDDHGGAFDGMAVSAESPDVDRMGSFATVEPRTGELKVLLLNKQPDDELKVQLDFGDFKPARDARLHRYSMDDPSAIMAEDIVLDDAAPVLSLPPYSINLLVLAQE